MLHPKLETWRQAIPILETHTYLANCSQGPQLRVVRQAMDAYLDAWGSRGMDWETWLCVAEEARSAFAALLAASPQDIAITASVSSGFSALIGALPELTNRRRLLISSDNFPTIGQIALAAKNLGFNTSFLSSDHLLQELQAQDLRDVAMLCVPHASYLTGDCQDLGALSELCRSEGVLLAVDAYQSLGAVPLDCSSGADAIFSGCQKYLLGIPGVAFFYLAPRLSEQLQPLATGWFGQAAPFDFLLDKLAYAPYARRFDQGTLVVAALYAAKAAIQSLLDIGLTAIHTSIRSLNHEAERLAAQHGYRLLSRCRPDERNGTTAILCKKEASALEAALRHERVLATARGPVLRFAHHYYNHPEDLKRAWELLLQLDA